MGYAATNIAYDPSSYKIQIVAAVVFLDLFLLILGHTWDPCPNMQTIINCRMLYVLCVVSISLIVYAVWHSALRVQFLQADDV